VQLPHPGQSFLLRIAGFLANTNKKQALITIRSALGMQPPPEPDEDEPKETAAKKTLRLTGLDVTRCPKCKGRLVACPLPHPEHPP